MIVTQSRKPLSWMGSLPAASLVSSVSSLSAGTILNVVEIGGDNEATDTIAAKWTGQTWKLSIANETVPGATVDSLYTAGTFATLAPAFVDRNHRFIDDPGTRPGGTAVPTPAFLTVCVAADRRNLRE